MKKSFLIIALAFLSLGLMAQEQETDDYQTPQQEQTSKKQSDKKKKDKKNHGPVFSGVSGGVTLHAGYLFSDSPNKIFSSSGLGSLEDVKKLPKDGVGIGIGATFRIHLIDCIHLGAEGHLSTMPLMKSGSSVRTGWAGAYCDYYFHLGPVRPMLGLGVGGGQMKRLFVPQEASYVKDNSTYYNASYTKTPFFYLDPYIGMEIGLGNILAIFIKIDYMLPFGYTGSTLTSSDIKWDNFVSPSGPRLHVGLLLGSMGKSKK